VDKVIKILEDAIKKGHDSVTLTEKQYIEMIKLVAMNSQNEVGVYKNLTIKLKI
jgi:hypothetical protein